MKKMLPSVLLTALLAVSAIAHAQSDYDVGYFTDAKDLDLSEGAKACQAKYLKAASSQGAVLDWQNKVLNEPGPIEKCFESSGCAVTAFILTEPALLAPSLVTEMYSLPKMMGAPFAMEVTNKYSASFGKLLEKARKIDPKMNETELARIIEMGFATNFCDNNHLASLGDIKRFVLAEVKQQHDHKALAFDPNSLLSIGNVSISEIKNDQDSHDAKGVGPAGGSDGRAQPGAGSQTKLQ